MADAVGKTWHNRPEDEKDVVVRLLLDNQREDDAVTERLITEFAFTPQQADAALNVDFPTGYSHLSLKAIDRLLPHLERGLVYQSVSDPEQSALHAAGYLRRDELQRRLFDELPDPTRVRLQDCRLGDIPNPVVKRALVELRKVVNAIIREYGKPDEVHVEMARSLPLGINGRKEYNKRIREQELRRDRAADEIRQYRQRYPDSGVRVNRESILRFLLWEEQAHECVYCQRAISQHQLFGGEVDVDHILPYSRSLDDSQSNKVLAHRQCNRDKGQRTPYEWLAETDPQRYDRICRHMGSLLQKKLIPYGKYRKFLQKELDLDQFIARQLADTGYIARATAEYLRCLFESDHHVLGLKGQHTAELRRQWGLNSVLRHDAVDMKNRDDHRHHAVDALVVALTDRRLLQRLARGFVERSRVDPDSGEQRYRQSYAGRRIDEPWPGFRAQVEDRVNRINVSHRPMRKVAGRLHEETIYGPTPEPGVFVVRKPLEELSASEIPLIRDEGVRRLIERRLAEHGIEIGRGKNASAKTLKHVLCDPANPITIPPSKKRLRRDPQAKGIPVRKVRLLRSDLTIQPIREQTGNTAFVKPGATHHLTIFEWEANGKTKREAVFVTQLEAIRRIAKGIEVIQRNPPQDHPTIPSDARFVMSLSRGEMVLATIGEEEKLLVLVTAVSTSKQLRFAEHTDGRRQRIWRFSPNTLQARKVTVDPIGRIRWAND